jgi:hypothetical protein
MSKRKVLNNKRSIPRLTSVEEAMEAVSEYLNTERYRDDPYAEDVTPDQLRGLIERIWADAYHEGFGSGYAEGRNHDD